MVQRDEHKADWSTIKLVAEDLAIPVILNGDVFAYDDFARARLETVSVVSFFVFARVCVRGSNVDCAC